MDTQPLPTDPSLPPVPEMGDWLSEALAPPGVESRLLSPAPTADPVLAELRDQVTDTDRVLVETINQRLALVAQIERHKAARGLPFIDPDREAWSLGYLLRANRGPLSVQGLRELYVEVLDLMKREVARGKS